VEQPSENDGDAAGSIQPTIDVTTPILRLPAAVDNAPDVNISSIRAPRRSGNASYPGLWCVLRAIMSIELIVVTVILSERSSF
jgi:hypothetical protein